MRVLITGSRAWRDYPTLRKRLSDLPIRSTIVHGAATGADAMAHVAAEALGFTTEPHWPDYEHYPYELAPLIRNQLMVGLGADQCLAFPTKGSRGTWHCVRFAEEAGIPVEIIGEWGINQGWKK